MIKVGYAMTGSFCTHKESLVALRELVQKGYDVYPILSYNAESLSTRFMSNEQLKESIKSITGRDPITTIQAAEPIGPKKLLDVVVVAPCTGNTLAKLANSITDTPVLMACKSHLRNNKPVVLAIATNDALSGNAKNIGALLSIKNFFFVPYGQDDPKNKPFSMMADFTKLEETINSALEGKQIQPLVICKYEEQNKENSNVKQEGNSDVKLENKSN